jgi:hypothetical protein
MNNPDVINVLQLLWPLILLQFIIQGYAIVDIARRKKTKNLNVTVWVLIIIFGEILGAVLYLIIGRDKEK